MNVIINPGSGPVEHSTFENAHRNILQFIEDSEIPLFIKKAHFIASNGGRFLFVLGTPLNSEFTWDVEMPGLPLENVRYISQKQNIWDFPRLYVDGSSWVWKFATIKKEFFKEQMEFRIQEAEDNIAYYRKVIKELEEPDEKEEI